MGDSKEISEERFEEMEQAFEYAYKEVTDCFDAFEIPGDESGAALHGALTALMVIAIQMARDKFLVAPMVSTSLNAAFRIVDPNDTDSVEFWDISGDDEIIH